MKLLRKNLEKQAVDNDHSIGVGFQEALLLGKVRMLRMDCSTCDFFSIINPETGEHLQSYSGKCRRKP